MRLPIYQVDAFAGAVFHGNPAAVCPLERWLEAPLMQSIAAENNLAETAFFVPRGDAYELRWFTPEVEVDLCGHATLASAFVIFERLERGKASVTFHSQSGPLTVRRDGERLTLDFPVSPPEACAPPPALEAGLGARPREVFKARDYMAVFDSAAQVRALVPRMDQLASLAARGTIVTAPGDGVDFVSRFFAPGAGIPEDPVTGSAHCTLIPYWAKRLGRTRLVAHQVSARGGELICEDRGERVAIGGRAVLYLEGTIQV